MAIMEVRSKCGQTCVVRKSRVDVRRVADGYELSNCDDQIGALCVDGACGTSVKVVGTLNGRTAYAYLDASTISHQSGLYAVEGTPLYINQGVKEVDGETITTPIIIDSVGGNSAGRVDRIEYEWRGGFSVEGGLWLSYECGPYYNHVLDSSQTTIGTASPNALAYSGSLNINNYTLAQNTGKLLASIDPTDLQSRGISGVRLLSLGLFPPTVINNYFNVREATALGNTGLFNLQMDLPYDTISNFSGGQLFFSHIHDTKSPDSLGLVFFDYIAFFPPALVTIHGTPFNFPTTKIDIDFEVGCEEAISLGRTYDVSGQIPLVPGSNTIYVLTTRASATYRRAFFNAKVFYSSGNCYETGFF